jgi:hypothetical protein
VLQVAGMPMNAMKYFGSLSNYNLQFFRTSLMTRMHLCNLWRMWVPHVVGMQMNAMH